MAIHSAEDYFDWEGHPCPGIFEAGEEVWAAIPRIRLWIEAALAASDRAACGVADRSRIFVGESVWIGKGTVIMPGACLQGPAWIGEGCRIGPGCWIRENVVIGNGAIVGNSCELKNCVVGESSEIPHWNYVGDSLLGRRVHLGAGVILSNWRHDHGEIPVVDERYSGGRLASGLPKFGAIMGDCSDAGAHVVLNPGSLIGRRSVLYPGTVWRGVLPADRLVKLRQEQVIVTRMA
jgi:NDP-sugar pyrophosphorylase family protein